MGPHSLYLNVGLRMTLQFPNDVCAHIVASRFLCDQWNQNPQPPGEWVGAALFLWVRVWQFLSELTELPVHLPLSCKGQRYD